MKLASWLAWVEVFRQGNEVLNPTAWKNGQIGVNTIATFLPLIAAAIGSSLPESWVLYIASALWGLVNLVITVITSKKVGFKAAEAAT